MKGITPMALAALSFSFCPLLYAIALESTNAITQAFYVQISITLVAGSFFACAKKSIRKLIEPLQELFKMPFDIWGIIVLSGVGAYIGTLFFMWALELMSEAGAAIIMESWPILAVFIAPMLIEKRWARFRIIDFVLMALLMFGLLMISAGEAGLSLKTFFQSPLFMFEGRGYNELYGVLCAIVCALCYAWAGVARPYFTSLLPHEFRIRHFKKPDSWQEALYAFWITCLVATPLSFLITLIFDVPVIPSADALLPVVGLGMALTAMGCLYAYALTIANNANINLLWYMSPVLAALWLAVFGYSEITELLIAGGVLIIIANIILILQNKDTKHE